jgi:cytochrome c-type biogenesis protein CcmH/NrfG
VELADRALVGDPQDVDALLVRARIHLLARRLKLAIADLEQAVRVSPNDLAALQLLAQAQKNAGLDSQSAATRERADRSRARRALMDRLTKQIDAQPSDPEPRWRLGQVAMEAEMDVLAYQSFQAALDLDPGYRPAREALAKLRGRPGFDRRSVVSVPKPVMGKARPARP